MECFCSDAAASPHLQQNLEWFGGFGGAALAGQWTVSGGSTPRAGPVTCGARPNRPKIAGLDGKVGERRDRSGRDQACNTGCTTRCKAKDKTLDDRCRHGSSCQLQPSTFVVHKRVQGGISIPACCTPPGPIHDSIVPARFKETCSILVLSPPGPGTYSARSRPLEVEPQGSDRYARNARGQFSSFDSGGGWRWQSVK